MGLPITLHNTKSRAITTGSGTTFNVQLRHNHTPDKCQSSVSQSFTEKHREPFAPDLDKAETEKDQ